MQPTSSKIAVVNIIIMYFIVVFPFFKINAVLTGSPGAFKWFKCFPKNVTLLRVHFFWGRITN